MIQFDEHIFQMGWFNHQLALKQTNATLFDVRFTDSLVNLDKNVI